MSIDAGREPPGRTVRSSMAFGGGVILLSLAGLVLWLTRELPQGTLSAVGPGFLPRWLSIGIALCGVALLFGAFLRRREAVEAIGLRGPLVITLAILAFAVTIRPFAIAGFETPGLGLVGAGPLAILISGYARQDADLLELASLGFGLTAFCMLLFGDILSLQIPLVPVLLSDLLPVFASSKTVLRASIAVLSVLCLAFAYGVRRRRKGIVNPADAPRP